MYDNLPDLGRGLVLYTALAVGVGVTIGITGLLAIRWLATHIHVAF